MRFSKHVSKLIFRIKRLQKEAIMLKTMTNKVAIYLNIFGALVTILL